MQESGSLAVFKVTARDQGHYKGPSGAFITYCIIYCFYLSFCYYFEYLCEPLKMISKRFASVTVRNLFDGDSVPVFGALYTN